MADERPEIDAPRSWSEAEISSAMRAGYDRSVPLEHRPPTSPKVQGVVVADAGRPTERSAAKVAEFAPGEIPARGSVISRSTEATLDIPVERVYMPGPESEVQDEVRESAGVQKVSNARREVATQADGTMAERPPPADASTEVGVIRPEIEQSATPRQVAVTVPGAEHGVGVQTAPRQVTDLSNPSPVNVQGVARETAEVQVQPEPPAQPPVETEPQPAGPQLVNPPVQPAPLEIPPKQKVMISSQKIGKHRLRVNFVGVSDSAVFLFFIDDENTNIFEPPLCGSDEPLTVRFKDQEFKCAYYGMSGEAQIGPFELFQVVLTRIQD